jgi:hypothetical protein
MGVGEGRGKGYAMLCYVMYVGIVLHIATPGILRECDHARIDRDDRDVNRTCRITLEVWK